jgi:transposase
MGDLFMSLIHTCESNGVNSFEYLIALQKHAAELVKNPAAWMPWNYWETLQQAGTSQPSA